MAANVSASGVGPFDPAAPQKGGANFFSRLLANLIEGRQERGRRIAYMHLARYSDATLERLGHDKALIRAIRENADKGVISF